MKILILNIPEAGSRTAIASYRFAESLLHAGMDVKILPGNKTDHADVVESPVHTFFQLLRRMLNFFIKPLNFLFNAKSLNRKSTLSSQKYALNGIKEHPWVKEADIIYLYCNEHKFFYRLLI